MEDQLPAAGGRVNALRQTFKPNVLGVEFCESFNEVLERAAKPIEPPDDEDVPFPEEVQGFLQAFALLLGPADCISEDFDTAGRFERVLLEVEVLVLGRYACVPDECHSPIVPKLIQECNM